MQTNAVAWCDEWTNRDVDVCCLVNDKIVCVGALKRHLLTSLKKKIELSKLRSLGLIFNQVPQHTHRNHRKRANGRNTCWRISCCCPDVDDEGCCCCFTIPDAAPESVDKEKKKKRPSSFNSPFELRVGSEPDADEVKEASQISKPLNTRQRNKVKQVESAPVRLDALCPSKHCELVTIVIREHSALSFSLSSCRQLNW